MARNILASLSSSKAGNLYGYVLPMALVTVTIQEVGTSFHLAEAETELVPDPEQQYYFRYNPSIFSSDVVNITFSEAGFLSNIRTSIEDQTGEFVSKLIDLGSAVTEIVSVPPTGTREIPVIRQQIDPFDQDQLDEINRQLKKKDETLSLEFKPIGKAPKRDRGGSEQRSGIYCKPMMTGELRLVHGASVSSQLIRIPDPRNIHFIEIPQAPWVKTDFEVQFNEYGYPTSIQLTKPSSALAFAEAPLKLVGAILELPSRLFRFQMNINRRKEEAFSEQVQIRESMNALQQKIAEMDASQQQSRGILSKLFGSKKGEDTDQRVSVPNQSGGSSGGGGGGGELDPEIANTVKKMQQDLKVMRQRMNRYEKTLSEGGEG